MSLLNLPLSAGSRSSRCSGPSIATTPSPRAPSHTISQHPYFSPHRLPYIGHPAFPSFAHVDAMQFPPATHYPPQRAHPPRTRMPYVPSTSLVGVPNLPPLGPPSYHHYHYHYPPPLPYHRTQTQQLPPFSTPVSPYVQPQRAPDWAPMPFQRPPTTSQRSDSSVSASQVSSTLISSISPVHTQPSESNESLGGPPAAAATAAAGNAPALDEDEERQGFSSAPIPSRSREGRSLDLPTRPSSAPAVFPGTAPHDTRSRPIVPVTQPVESSELGGQIGQIGQLGQLGQPGPDLSNGRTVGRRHKQ